MAHRHRPLTGGRPRHASNARRPPVRRTLVVSSLTSTTNARYHGDARPEALPTRCCSTSPGRSRRRIRRACISWRRACRVLAASETAFRMRDAAAALGCPAAVGERRCQRSRFVDRFPSRSAPHAKATGATQRIRQLLHTHPRLQGHNAQAISVCDQHIPPRPAQSALLLLATTMDAPTSIVPPLRGRRRDWLSYTPPVY